MLESRGKNLVPFFELFYGLADSFNVTGIYENGPISFRVAYNWRDKYLSAVNRGGGRSPSSAR